MKTTTTPRALTFLALVLTPALLPSCQRSNDPSPTTSRVASGNAAAAAEAPIPCGSETPDYNPDGNQLGSYKQSATRSKAMGNWLTQVGTDDFVMTQVKYLITPSGKEQSIWEGKATGQYVPAVKTEYVLPNPAHPDYIWSECGKPYSSKCVRWPDGRVTLSLTTDVSMLPHGN